MTLKTACDIGYNCGLTTIDESIRNIEIHAPSFFPYITMGAEMRELYADLLAFRGPLTTSIKEYLETYGD